MVAAYINSREWVTKPDTTSTLMSKWQPIETAPKNGTLVDLWIINHLGAGQRLLHCRWEQDYEDEGRWEQLYSETRGCFFTAFDERARATHWMPLPDPPENEKERATEVMR